MAASGCTVSFTDTEGLKHSVDVQAETLFEAACLAVSVFRASPNAGTIGPVTELEITVHQPETRHRVTMSRVESWLRSNGRSPREHSLKTRLKGLLDR